MATDRFKDIDLNFIAHPATGDISIKTNEEAIRRALRNLIQLRTGEKPFHPEIASGVRDLLFEPATPLTAIRIQNEIERVIRTYEPRVVLNNVRADLNTDGNSFSISISFNVKNVISPSRLSFSLERLS